MMRSCAAVLACWGMGFSANGQTAAPLLSQRVPEISFVDVPLESVVAWVAESEGVNVVVRWQTLEDVGVERDTPITLRLRNVRLSQALLMVLAEAGGVDTRLAYRAEDGVLTISTADDINREQVVVVYDVRDLLVTLRNFAGPRIELEQSGGAQAGGGVLTGDSREEAPPTGPASGMAQGELQNLVRVIRATIEPDTWDGNGGTGTIETFGGQLIVRNTVLVHQKLGGPVGRRYVGVVR